MAWAKSGKSWCNWRFHHRTSTFLCLPNAFAAAAFRMALSTLLVMMHVECVIQLGFLFNVMWCEFMCNTIHYVLGVMWIVFGTPCLLSGVYHWKCMKSRYSLHMYYTICSLQVGHQLMNMTLLEQILHSCIIALDSAIHDTPEIVPSCNQKLDEVTY